MGSQGKCLVLVPAGPGMPVEFVQDTLDSVVAHIPASECAICLLDNTPSGEFEQCRTGDVPRFYVRRAEVYAFSDIPQSPLGPLWLEQMRVLADMRARYDFDVVLRLDTDALVTGDAPHREIIAAALQNPDVGIFGAFTVRGDGTDKSADMKKVGMILRSEMSIRRNKRNILRNFHYLLRALTLKRLYWKARRNGYEAGLTVTGGAAFITRRVVDRWADMKMGTKSSIRYSRLPDDVLFGLSVYAAGYRLSDAPGGVMAVNWIGLPFDPPEITRRRIKVIHSVKAADLAAQSEIRAHFKSARQSGQSAPIAVAVVAVPPPQIAAEYT